MSLFRPTSLTICLLALAISCARFPRRTETAHDPRVLCTETNLLAPGATATAMQCASLPEASETLSAGQSFLLAEALLSAGEPDRAFPFFRRAIVQTDNGDAAEFATASIMSLIAARDRIPHFDVRVIELEAELRSEGNELSPAFWYELNNMRLAIARKRGNDTDADHYRAALGFVLNWQTVGPIGPYAWDYMDQAHPLEGLSPWPREVSLGPGRPDSAPRPAPNSTGRVYPGEPTLAAHGAVLGRAPVRLEKKGRVWFRLQTGSSCSVTIDGAEAIRLDRRQANPAYTHWFRADLKSGEHLLGIKLVGPNPSSPFTLSAFRKDGTPALTPADSWSKNPPEPRTAVAEHRPAATPAQKLAAALIALWHDNSSRFGKVVAGMTEAQRSSPRMLLAVAEAALIDPNRPADLSYEHARSLYRNALTAEPLLVEARGQLARHALSEGRMEEALDLLTEGIRLSPREPLYLSRFTGAYLDAGWHAEAERAISQLRELLPASCVPIEWELALARSLGQFLRSRELARDLSLCDRLSLDYLDMVIRGRDWSAARQEQRRMEALFPRAIDVLNRRYASASAMNDPASIEEQLLLAIDLEPYLAEHYLRLSDFRRSREDLEGAVRALKMGIGAIQGPAPTLSKALTAIGAGDQLERFRIDGREIIDNFFAESPSYESAAIYILDRAVYLYRPDGTHTVVVHTITQVGSAEAIEAHGELELPPEADILTLRIVGEDGDLKEPYYIEGKSSLSMPSLAVGDIIEIEYATYNTPNQIYPGGFDTDRFYFQDFQTAFHRSEIIVVAPVASELQFDPRGDAPAPAIRETETERIATYRVERSVPHPDELAGPNPVEYLPSTRVASNVSWKTIAHRLSDMLADRNVPTPKITMLAHSLCESVAVKACHRALYRYASDSIDHEPDLFAQASHIFERRAGHRTRALQALLLSTGASVDLALIHPSTADQTVDALPSLDQFSEVALLLNGGTWLFPEQDNAPFGYLPPRLRDRPAVLLSSGQSLRTDGGAVPRDTETVQIQIENPTGETARLTVRETLLGQGAIDWRSALKGGGLPGLERWFQENYLANAIPGGGLTSLSYDNLDKPELPFVLEYTITLNGYTRPEGVNRVARALFASNLLGETGGLATRSTDLVIAARYDRTVEVSWKLAEATSCELPLEGGTLNLKSKWGTLHLETIHENATAGYKYTLKLTDPRIEAAEYPHYAAFAQKVDRTTQIEPLFRSDQAP